MRYRVRGKLPTGQPIIIKPEAANPFEAASMAERALKNAGHDLTVIKDVSIRPMANSKQSSVYVGAVPKAKPRRRPQGNAAAATDVKTPDAKTPAAAAAPAKKK